MRPRILFAFGGRRDEPLPLPLTRPGMPPIRKHITYVVHGARADRPELRQMVSWVGDRGHAVDVRVTWNTGDAEVHAADAARRGTDVVVACGGDGTLNEVVNGLD